MTALEVKEDGQIWLIPSLPEHPSFCNKRACIHSEDSQNGPPCSECETFFKEYETALASAERILVSNQEVARQYLRLHEAKAFEASTDNWPDFTLKPGIYPIPDLKWEVKAEPIDCPDGIEGCEVMHLRNVAVISLPESKSESPLIGQFRKKPVVIKAVQWTGDNLKQVIEFTGLHDSARQWADKGWEHYEEVVKINGLKIFTLEGPMNATIGDWIIKGVSGEFYPCKPDIFAKTYEPVGCPLIGERSAEEILRSCSGFAYEKWKKNHPNTFKWVIEAMERHASQFQAAQSLNPVKPYIPYWGTQTTECKCADCIKIKQDYQDALRQFLGRKVIITPKDGIPYEPEVLTEYHLTQLHRWGVKII